MIIFSSENDELPSITEIGTLQGIGTGVMRRALEALAADGLITVRHGRTSVVAGEPAGGPRPGRMRPEAGHDCSQAGCGPHQCHPQDRPGHCAGGRREGDRRGRVGRRAARPVPVARRGHWRRRGELGGLQMRGGQRVRKDTKTHQDRWLAIDPDTCALVRNYLDESRAALAAVGVELADDAYLFSNDPVHARPWNPDWATHKVADAAAVAGIELDIKGCGTTPPASCSPPASTCATPPRAWATLAAARPR
jgi:hypothetical protein